MAVSRFVFAFAGLIALFTGAPRAFAQFPYAYSAANSASYDNTTLAQGSLIVLFGYDLGPNQLVKANTFPLTTTLSGTSVAVTSGSTTLLCPMIYTSAIQIAAILPSRTPPGLATLKVSYNGATAPDYAAVHINVVPSSVGIYTLNSQGTGPGIFTTPEGSLKSLTVAAKPGDVLNLWATGAGPRPGDDSLPPTAQNFPGVEVFVGVQSAKVLYAGPSPCCVGLDQIAFEVPPVTGSCFMPVGIRSGGIVSNFVNLSVSASGAPCSDAPPGLPPSFVTRALAGEPLKMAALIVAPTGLQGRILPGALPSASAALSKLLNRNVTEQEAQRIATALRNSKSPMVRRALGKYGQQLNGLEPQLRKIIEADPTLTPIGVTALLASVTGVNGIVPLLGSAILPPLGTCTAIGSFPAPTSRLGARALDAGAALTFTAPSGPKSLVATGQGKYQAVLGSAFNGPVIAPGTYGISGPGGRDVTPFFTTANIPGNIVWSNKAATTVLDRSQPLTVAWTGGGAGHVLIAGSGSHGGFFCTENAAKGTFTVPTVFLSKVGRAGDSAVLFLAPHPFDHPLTIPGMDLGYFVDGSTDLKQLSLR